MSIKLFFNCLHAVPLAALLLLMALAHSAARAQGHYQSAITAAGPTSYWRLNESSGPTAVNFGSLGAAANGTYIGSPTYGLAGPNPTGGFEGFATTNSSVAFPTGSYVALPSGFLPTGNNPRTYELWFNADAGPTNAQTAFSHGINATGQRINITAANNAVAIAVNGHNYGKTGLALTGWNHLAITLPSPLNATLPVTSNEFQFYLNGQSLTGLSSIAGSAVTVNTQNAAGSIGRDSTGAVVGSYLGNLDEVAVYNGALTAGQIAHHYNAALGLEQTKSVTLSDYTTASKTGESPATTGAFAGSGPLFIRERAAADNAALEVQAFIKFNLTGITGDITNATLILPETNKLNNSFSADIFGAQVLEDWNSLSLAPVFGDGLTDGTDVTGEFFIGNNGNATAGPAVNINHYVDLTDLVQMWIDNPSMNFGLRLRLNDQNAGAAFDASSVRLLIGQVVPEPPSYATWLVIVGLCAGAWGWWRRKKVSREI